MAIETLTDILEELADLIGVYNSHTDGENVECRCCFVSSLNQRIRDAVKIETILEENLNSYTDQTKR